MSLSNSRDRQRRRRRRQERAAAAATSSAVAEAEAKAAAEADAAADAKPAAAAAPLEKAEAKAASAEVPLAKKDAKGINIVNKCITHTLTFITHSILIASLSALHVAFLITNVSAFDHMNAFLKCISATRSCECLPVLIALRIVNVMSSSRTASGG